MVEITLGRHCITLWSRMVAKLLVFFLVSNAYLLFLNEKLDNEAK